MSKSWLGKTRFYILRPPPEPGFTYIYGRKTKIRFDTRRPGNVWPEIWDSLSKKKRKNAIAKWEIVSKELNSARDKRKPDGIDLYVSANDEEYAKVISDANRTHS